MVLPPSTFTFEGYVVEADWNRNQAYDHALSDITAYVRGLEDFWGMKQAYQEVSEPAEMVITLDNSDGDWDVTDSGSTFGAVFRKNVQVRFRLRYELDGDPGAYSRFIGQIKSVEIPPSPQTAPYPVVRLLVSDPMLQLLDAEYYPPLLQNVRTDEVLQRMFNDVVIASPYPHNYWMLGVEGCSELSVTTTLYDHDLTLFTQGETTLDFAGDNADGGRGIPAQSYIRDVVAAECGGKFYWDAQAGKFRFWSRHEYTNYSIPPEGAAVILPANIRDDPGPTTIYADDISNKVNVRYELRKTGTPGSVVYTATNVPFTLQAGQSRTITVRYRDPEVENARVGVTNAITPLAGTDFTANSASDGSGTNLTGSLGVSVEFAATSAKVTLVNPTGATLYVTLFQLRGTPLTTYAREIAAASDGASIADNGLYEKTLEIPFISDPDLALDYARSQVTHFSTPVERIDQVTLVPLQEVLSLQETFFRTVGYVATVSGGAYIIVGERLLLSGDGQVSITHVLEPLNRSVYWALGQVGRSELGVTTILSF